MSPFEARGEPAPLPLTIWVPPRATNCVRGRMKKWGSNPLTKPSSPFFPCLLQEPGLHQPYGLQLPGLLGEDHKAEQLPLYKRQGESRAAAELNVVSGQRNEALLPSHSTCQVALKNLMKKSRTQRGQRVLLFRGLVCLFNFSATAEGKPHLCVTSWLILDINKPV